MTFAHLSLWVIYRNPIEAPGAYLVRRWGIVPSSGDPVPGEAFPHETLAEARASIPAGSIRLERSPHDDSAVVETWV